jgi:MFS family permease
MNRSQLSRGNNRLFGVLFISAIILCTLLNPLNSSTISVALPTLLSQLHTASTGITWIVSGYYLGSAIAQPVMGKLGDVWGRTRLIYLGLALMVITALLAPLSQSLIVFVLWRVIQAVATSMIFPNAIALVRQHRSNDLGKILSWISMAGGIAVAIGPTVGGLLIDWTSWHAIFWLNIPVACVSGVLLWFVAPNLRNGDQIHTTRNIGKSFDWYGMVLFAGTITTWLFWCNSRHHFISSSLLVLIVSVILTGSLIVVEFRQSSPLIPIRWFSQRQFTFSTLVTIISNLIMYSVLYGIPVFLQSVRHFNASNSGLFLLIFTIVMTIASPIGGRFAQGTGRRIPMVISGILLFAGAIFLWLGAIHSLVILGIGLGLLGLSFAISNIITQQMFLESVPQKETGQASGVYTMWRYLGTIVSSVFIGSSIHSANSAIHLFLVLACVSFIVIILNFGLEDIPKKGTGITKGQ